VNEVIGGVLLRVGRQVLFQQGALRFLFRRRAVGQFQPSRFESLAVQNGFHRRLNQFFLLGPFGLCCKVEPDDQRAILFLDRTDGFFKTLALLVKARDRALGGQNEAALLVVILAVVFGRIGSDKAEMHKSTVIQLEAEVREGFSAFDVILIAVRPVQHDLFPGIGDGIGITLVPALADEIALVVVAREEGQQVREDLIFMLRRGPAGGCKFLLEAQNSRSFV